MKSFNFKDFTLKENNRAIEAESWKEYYGCLCKKIKDDADKESLREFRKELKESEYEFTVIHKKTRLSKDFIVKKTSLAEYRKIRKDLVSKMLTFIKECRNAQRNAIKVDTRNFDGANVTTVGGVRTKPNLTNSFAQFLTINDPIAAKKPRMPNRNYLGIELEFNEKSLDDIGTRGLAALFKKEGLARYVSCTTDGSCGHEVRVCVEQDGYEPILRKIIGVITKEGYKVNHKCGTHVHLDMRNRDLKVAYHNLYMAQGFLQKFLTQERLHNRFCKPNIYSNFDDQLEYQQKSAENRYAAINTLSVKKHGTLELRMHQGTLNADALINWINLLIKIVDCPKKMEMESKKYKVIRKTFNVDKDKWVRVLNQIRTLRRSDKKLKQSVDNATFVNPHFIPNVQYLINDLHAITNVRGRG